MVRNGTASETERRRDVARPMELKTRPTASRKRVTRPALGVRERER